MGQIPLGDFSYPSFQLAPFGTSQTPSKLFVPPLGTASPIAEPVASAAKAFRVPSFISVPVAAVSIIGLLGGNAARDSNLARLGFEYDETTGLTRPIREPNTGLQSGAPPFKGGQSVGVEYYCSFTRTTVASPFEPTGTTVEVTRTDLNLVVGKVLSITQNAVHNNTSTFVINTETGVVYAESGGGTYPYSSGFGQTIYSYSNIRFIRADGLPDTGGDPASTEAGSPSGYVGTMGESLSDRQNKVLPPDLSAAIGWGNTKPVPSAIVRAAIGLGKEKSPLDLFPAAVGTRLPTKSPTLNPTKNPTDSPLKAPNEFKEKDKKNLIPSLTPDNPNDINSKLFQIGSILGVINANTTPEAQKVNAKAGACDALNSPSCTQNLKDDIKNPINQKIDAAQAVNNANQVVNDVALKGIAANQFYQNGQFALIAENFTKVKTFLDNTIIDRAIGAANFAMNVHNALMLSNNLGKTLAGTVDGVMSLTPFQFTDATTGNKTTLTRAFSSNVSAIIVNLIGQDLYTELDDAWKVANRFYQGLTNAFNKTERLLGAQSKVAQKTGIEVAYLGNALVANGVVNANSYPPMAATKEANTPPDLLADIRTPIGNIQAGLKNLNAITKSVAGTVKQVTALQKDFGKLQDLTNKESKVRKSMRTQSARQAKIKAKFTTLQIKQIKAKGQKNANP